ncbi:hypothetical protein CRG98_033879 [Punica granatum]|uniref:Uncharacterized protein n=1 Tax=Punica granatum TaxID=22663 RepID=A0A2I0IQP5_PUNGR|nr:hypothetical protein CRG98_033879 [Punica granatum]
MPLGLQPKNGKPPRTEPSLQEEGAGLRYARLTNGGRWVRDGVEVVNLRPLNQSCVSVWTVKIDSLGVMWRCGASPARDDSKRTFVPLALSDRNRSQPASQPASQKELFDLTVLRIDQNAPITSSILHQHP